MFKPKRYMLVRVSVRDLFKGNNRSTCLYCKISTVCNENLVQISPIKLAVDS